MTSKRQAPRGLAIIGVMWPKFMPTLNCGGVRILQTNLFSHYWIHDAHGCTAYGWGKTDRSQLGKELC